MKKNKKIYNFTEKQRRRDKSIKVIYWYTVGKYSKVNANREFRIRNKRILQRNLSENKEIPFLRHRKYMWWDW